MNFNVFLSAWMLGFHSDTWQGSITNSPITIFSTFIGLLVY